MSELSRSAPEQTGKGSGLATFLAWVCLAGAALAPLFQTVSWLLTPAFIESLILNASGAQDLSWLELPIRLGARAICLPVVLVASYALLNLRSFFRHTSHGRTFSRRALSGFKVFAWSIAALAVLAPLQGAALSAFLSWCAPGEGGQLQLELGSDDLTTLFVALVFVSVAHLLDRACAQQDELDTFI